MDISNWLEEIGLSRYTETLSEFPLEDLVEFTDDDFKELGVLTPHRKKLLEAIATLNNDASSNDVSTTSDANTSSSSFSIFIKDLPQVIAIPLHEYAEEDHPGMKLWAACDAIELLLKFLVIIGAADRRQHGELDDKLLKELWGKIEMPTLGAWLSMAISLAQTKSKQTLMLPEIDKYVNETLKTLLYGPDNPGTADTSFLKLRNRLAHGGGLTRKEAERLIGIWQEPFEKTIEALSWLSDINIVGLDENVPMELKGTSDNLTAAPTLDVSRFEGDSDGVWLVRGENTLSLWPMALFGYPSVSNAKGNVDKGDVNSTQIYVRKDVVQLQFTPLGAEGFSHSEAGVSAVEAFQSLFSLKRANKKATEKAFKIQDFGREIQKDANQMVGRLEEQEHIESSFRDIEQGIVWITGPAGIGKSFLVARLAQDLIDNNTDDNKIILPYRFKSGDDARCNRDAFATFAIERLVAMGALIDNVKVDEKGKAEDRLKSCLDYLNKDKKVIFVLDGLDELLSRDASFAEEIPLGLDSMRITWVCSGRPEPELEKVFSNSRVINPYPNGLPAMQTQDIRSMLLERIGLFRNKLLAGDKEKGDEIVNPFIDLVAKRAEGLPLFVNYVTQDVQQGNYPLDGTANLPKGLTAYHEKLIAGLGVGALQALLTPLVATLAMANEPLAEQEIITFLRLREEIPDGEAGDKLVAKGLAAIASMLRRAPDPEGEDGFMLHHLSLREHILTTDTMSHHVEKSRKAFAKSAMSPDAEASISNYLYRTGVDHLLTNNQVDDAREKLLDIDYLGKMFNLGKQNLDILQYWLKIGDHKQGEEYVAFVNRYLERELKENDLDVLKKFLQLCLDSGWSAVGVETGELITEASRTLLGADHKKILNCLGILAELYKNNGLYNKSEKLLNEVLISQKDLLGVDHIDTLGTTINLGELYNNTGDYIQAENLLKSTSEICKKNLGENHNYTLMAMHNLAVAFDNLDKPEKAEIINLKILEIRKKMLGLENTDTITSMNNLAMNYLAMEDYQKAEPLLREVLELNENLLGFEHPNTLSSINNLSVLLSNIEHFSEAEMLLQRNFNVSKRVRGESHPDTILAMNNLGCLYLDVKKYEDAESIFIDVIKLQQRILGSNHPNTEVFFQNLIELYDQTGEVNKSIPFHEKIIKIKENSLGLTHLKTLNSKQNVAVILGNNKEYRKAIQLLKEVLLIRREKVNDNPNDDPDDLSVSFLSSTLSALGRVCGQDNCYEEGITYLQESIEIRRKLLEDNKIPYKQLIMVLDRIKEIYKLTGKEDQLLEIETEIEKIILDNKKS
ncbi:tetratricopeptide repeat protein [Alphaproteobacteria bacterium]|nr:tetratricopeptide repeat protein [Alphaproteobacteria bacterium]